MDFFLFLLVNATLFLRPAEVIPGMQDVQLYTYLIVPCLLLALPRVLEQLRSDILVRQPITICVLGLLVLVPLSQLGHLETEKALLAGLEFAKVAAYYLLLVAIVNTPGRLRSLLFWLVLFTAGTALLAVLRYQGVIELPTLTTLADRRDDELGQEQVFLRLAGTGIFRDPNDFTLLLVLGIPLTLYFLTESAGTVGRLVWLAPLALFGYALALTQSRGGFLAVAVGLLVLFRARFGKGISLVLGILVLPALFLVLGSRQTDIFTTGDTAQQRYQLWSDGLVLFQESPLIGVGVGEFQPRAGMVAHNSYVQAYAELGFLGGTVFLGAFLYGLWTLWRIGPERTMILDPALGRLRPYVLAVVAGYAVAMLSLTHVYTVPTYTILGLATVYLGQAVVYPPVAVPRFSSRLAQRFAVASVGFLLATYVLVRFVVRWR
jgi:O-antigen ligase